MGQLKSITENIMVSLFWTGKNLSPFLKTVMNMNSLLAWLSGSARDIPSMKNNVKGGFEGAYSNDVVRYDDVGSGYFSDIAHQLLENVDCNKRKILDVGCGTGILSFLALEKGATHVTCGDISEFMLNKCRNKAGNLKIIPGVIDFRLIDAESIPFANDTFDCVISSMVLGLVPSQDVMIREMVRVLKPGGMLALSTHGPNMWKEPFNAAFMAVLTSRYLFDLVGYRVEFWPRSVEEMKRMVLNARLHNPDIKRIESAYAFKSEDDAYNFFASASGSWWNARIKPDKIEPISRLMLNSFKNKGIKTFTEDVVFAYGMK
jgi:ubiquinone/menaquinone biosynthesis C-methylase UbiE